MLNIPNLSQLEEIAKALKTILAADESPASIEKRIVATGKENTAENRLWARKIMLTAAIDSAFDGVILHTETYMQHDDYNSPLYERLLSANIKVIIKLDKGMSASGFTKGIDSLYEDLSKYNDAVAVKWRWAYKTDASDHEIDINCALLTEFAIACLKSGKVPILEPELLMDGNHDIETNYDVQTKVLNVLYGKLYAADVPLQATMLKLPMVLPGKDFSGEQPSLEDICNLNVELLHTLPQHIGGFVYLSGGLDPVQATSYLNAVNSYNGSFLVGSSFGRGSHNDFYKHLAEGNESLASISLQNRATCNAKAADGEYEGELAEATA